MMSAGVLVHTNGVGVFVPVLDVVADVQDEFFNGDERAAAHRLAREDAEPGLDQVEPRGARSSGVKADVWVRIQPLTHVGRFPNFATGENSHPRMKSNR